MAITNAIHFITYLSVDEQKRERDKKINAPENVKSRWGRIIKHLHKHRPRPPGTEPEVPSHPPPVPRLPRRSQRHMVAEATRLSQRNRDCVLQEMGLDNSDDEESVVDHYGLGSQEDDHNRTAQEARPRKKTAI